MAKALSREVMWQARQMYEEKDELGRRRWSQMQIAAKLMISETSVFRAIHNAGRFATIQGTPLPEAKTDELLQQEADASLERFKKLVAEKKEEQTRGDRLVEELRKQGGSESAVDRLKGYLGED